MLLMLFKIITFYNMYTPGEIDEDGNFYFNAEANNVIKLGKRTEELYLWVLYKESVDKSLTLSQFKIKYLKENSFYNSIDDVDLHFHIGTFLSHIMEQCDLIINRVIKSGKNNLSVILPSKKVLNLTKEWVNLPVYIPLTLPMIVKPKDYSENQLGGYFLNDVDYTDRLISTKFGYKSSSKIDSKGLLYSVVNKLMKTAFKINEDLLDYLIRYNHVHKLLIDGDPPFSDVTKRNKYQDKKYQQFMSDKMLQEYIIRIASTFRKVPEIYFPIMLDNRGRLYPRTSYLNYQGSELAKALLTFAHYDIINRNDKESFEYLIAYGATCYGNGLERRSYKIRVEWVNKHWNDILNFDSNDIVSNADQKFLFLAFCFEFRRYNRFLNSTDKEFKTNFPIQLDGTCNGFQHLALLSNEIKLFDSLNLGESEKNDDPRDFYAQAKKLLIS